MLKQRCRVCGESATDPDTRRIWWVMPSALPVNEAPQATTHAPTCRACVPEALTACPALRRGLPALYTVGSTSPIGVLANLYGQDDDGRVVELRHQVGVGLDDVLRLHQALATQLIVLLEDVVRVERW
ncbi:hypothetical protein [Streptosporangium canum]|nr:hypothetical protein [Streptosporangium canum]